MRIAFILPGSGISGGVRSTQRYASGLLERGHEVLILYKTPKASLRNLVMENYIRMRYRNSYDWLKRFAGPLRSYRKLTADTAGRNDIIIAVGPWAARELDPLPVECGVKVEHVRGTGQTRDLVLEAWRRPWPKIVVANHLRRELESLGLGPVAAVVPHGVDENEYYPSLPEECRAGVGTIWHKGRAKDPEVIIAALQIIRTRHPDVPLHLFGHQQRPRELPPGSSFVRYPPIALARDCYSRCKVWFCASRTEGFPNPVLEAMACGCVVVSTDCGGPADMIQDGINGYLVPVGDAEAIARRVSQILDDELLRREMAGRVRATATSFSWHRSVERLEEALYSILEDAHPSHDSTARGVRAK